jgi:hypothetical protein
MCYCEDNCEDNGPDFPQVETEHIARKSHVCSECGSDIEPGEKYTRIFGVWDGHPSVFKQCEFCRKIWNILVYECDLDCLCFGEALAWAVDYEPEIIAHLNDY